MKRLVGISIGYLIRTLGEKNALDAAKKAGADAVDFNLTDQDLRKKSSIYAQGEEAVREHYSKLGEYARSIGILISQTHGRMEGLRGDAREDEVLLQNLRLDGVVKLHGKAEGIGVVGADQREEQDGCVVDGKIPEIGSLHN